MNAKMAELREAFEAAGFSDVKTVLSSGNVVFSARPASEAALQDRAEAAMEKHLGAAFLAVVRSVDDLKALIASDPWRAYRVKAGSKRVVTFLREPPGSKPKLPAELSRARIHGMKGREVFTTYLPDPRGPVFMTLIERTFGKEVTTRTWETVGKVAR
jgi:uncharacterized protein (DUF1697 family)